MAYYITLKNMLTRSINEIISDLVYEKDQFNKEFLIGFLIIAQEMEDKELQKKIVAIYHNDLKMDKTKDKCKVRWDIWFIALEINLKIDQLFQEDTYSPSCIYNYYYHHH